MPRKKRNIPAAIKEAHRRAGTFQALRAYLATSEKLMRTLGLPASVAAPLAISDVDRERRTITVGGLLERAPRHTQVLREEEFFSSDPALWGPWRGEQK